MTPDDEEEVHNLVHEHIKDLEQWVTATRIPDFNAVIAAFIDSHSTPPLSRCVGGPMDGSTLTLRSAYTIVRLPAAPDGEYRRTHVDVGRWEYHWVVREERRTLGGTSGTNPPPAPPSDRG